ADAMAARTWPAKAARSALTLRLYRHEKRAVFALDEQQYDLALAAGFQRLPVRGCISHRLAIDFQYQVVSADSGLVAGTAGLDRRHHHATLVGKSKLAGNLR